MSASIIAPENSRYNDLIAAEQQTILGAEITPAPADGHTLVYTPTVAITPRRLGQERQILAANFNELVRSARESAGQPPSPRLTGSRCPSW
ncbi:MAG: hypothetical protein ACTHMJ_22030 [Thermomicrobiales bacterium]